MKNSISFVFQKIMQNQNITLENLFEENDFNTQSQLIGDSCISTLDNFANLLKRIRSLEAQYGNDPNFCSLHKSINDLIAVYSSAVIVSLDLSVILPNLFNKNSISHIQFYIKHGYHIIFEGNKTYNKHLNKFKDIIENFGEPYKSNLNNISKMLREFRKGGRIVQIEKIRNNLSGHINEDFSIWHEGISKLKVECVVKTIIHYMDINKKLFDLCNDVLLKFQTDLNNYNLGK